MILAKNRHISSFLRFRFGIIVIFALFIGISAQSQTPQNDSSVAVLLNQAYGLMNSDPNGAKRLFERVCERDSTNILARRQLAYIYLGERNYTASLDRFEASERIRSSDTIRLQVAYVLAQLGRTEESKTILSQLRYAEDPAIRAQAEAQLRGIEVSGSPARTWPRLYSEIFYDTRWKSTFFNISFQLGEYIGTSRRLGIYGVAAIATDTKSTGGAVPTIISDNSLILGGGVRVNALTGLFFEIQEGIAYHLIESPDYQRVENDFRILGVYGNGLYAPFELHSNLRAPFRPSIDFYSSVGFYSRYHNTIGYFQLRPGVRLLEVSHAVTDVYALGKLVLDTRHEFYNNIFEAGGGLRVTPDVNLGLHLVGEYIHGMYLDVSAASTADREQLYDRTYDCFRFMLIVDTTF